jgi:hypothetical protein
MTTDKDIINFNDVSLRQRCFDIPEQYSAYIEDIYVGYVKVNSGKVKVFDSNEYLVCSFKIKGDNVFEENERDFFLSNSKIALILSMMFNLTASNESIIKNRKEMYSAIYDLVCDGLFTIEECLQCYEVMYRYHDI